MNQPNYRQVSSCANCRHALVKSIQDCETAFFCEHGALPYPGPQWLSQAWFERFPKAFEEEELQTQLMDQQEEWEKDQQVDADCICDNYESRPETAT